MNKLNFYNRGQSLIGIIIVLVVVGLIGGGLYYYFSKQITEISEITEKSTEEEISPEEKIEEKPTEEAEPEITCQDECTQTGLKRCSNNGYQTCGNYDEDDCLEWSSITNCPINTACRNGICESIEVLCQNKFKMAFILVAKDRVELTSERINRLNQIKNYFSKDFHTATQNLGHMDTSYGVVMMVDDGSLISQNYVIETAVTKKLYESSPDEFDFITIYTTFETPSNQFHVTVKNNIEGIGEGIFDNSERYGSDGKLMGVNFMKNIDMYDDPNPDSFRSSGLLHETGHQWCCSVGDDYDYGPKDSNLPILGSHGIHWHCVLQVHDFNTNQGDPMGGCYWIDNGDGTFTRKDVWPKVPIYHKLTLYLMGLVPKEKVPNVKLILPEKDPPYWQWYEPLKASVKYITVNDIIARYGEVRCMAK